MNGLTAGLAAAQRSVSPAYMLEIVAGPRATAWGTGGAPWQAVAAFPAALAGWHSQSIATDAVAHGGGVLRAFLSWKQGALACQFVAAGDLGSAAAWAGNAAPSVATFTPTAGIDAPRPALTAANGLLHLYYALPDGNVYWRSSGDGGATWSGAAAVYSGGDAEGDLCATCFAGAGAADSLHWVQFATRSDTLRLRGASRKGGGAWQVWPVHGSATGWTPVGISATGAQAGTLFAWARTTDPHAHYLGALACTLDASGGLAARDAGVAVVWLVTGAAAIRPACHAVGPGLGGWLHTCQEQSAGRAYACVGGVDVAPARVEEPAPVTAAALPAAPLERHLAPLELGAQTLLVGLGAVYASAHVTGDVAADGDGVIEYRYTVEADAGGELTLVAPVDSPLAACAPGWGLWLTRRCSKGQAAGGSDSGAVTLGLRVVRVERHPDAVRIVALDALGLLAATRARRPLQFTPYAATTAAAVAQLAAWAGLDALCSGVTGAAPLAQWSGGEDGLTALRRLLCAQAVGLNSRAAAGARPQIVLAVRGSTPLETLGAGGHPLAARVQVAEARTPRLVVVHGLAARGAPEEGEEWALASTALADPTQRAQPRYWLNRNLDAAAQVETAAALLAQIARAQPAGWVEMQAHLALEPGDCVMVEGETVYVQRIEERWERRRLAQRVVYGR